jgi:hypothetical protein
MTRGRSTLLLLVVALGLGAYIYFVEMKREPSDTPAPADRVFENLDAGAITAMTLTASNGDQTSVRREGAGWQMTAPVEAKADAAEVSGVTSNLASLDLSRVVDEAPTDLAAFGLDAPRISVGFTTDGRDERLLLGGRTATGGDIYAKLEKAPRVFLIPSWLETSLDRTTFQLRDKAIASFDRTTVDAISVIGRPGTIALAKNGDRWTIQQPIEARADAGAVDTLLNRLSSGQMQAIVADDPATLDVYGLAPPRTTVTASANGKVVAQLLVGADSGDAAVHMKDDARAVVFTVDTTLAADLERAVADYRDTRLFSSDTSSATRISVTRGESTQVFERTAATGDAAAAPTWSQTSPAPAVATDRIAEFASRLQTMRAESWEARVPAGTSPVATLVVASDGGVEETVRLVRGANGVFALRDDEPGAARLPLSSVDELLRVLDEAAS